MALVRMSSNADEWGYGFVPIADAAPLRPIAALAASEAVRWRRGFRRPETMWRSPSHAEVTHRNLF